MADVILRLSSISKTFNGATVVDDLSLEVEDGEIFTLLGPSGCGKSTTLRMIAGLEDPDSGEIVYQGRTLVSVSQRQFVQPYHRNMGMVFQSYGIWPHMTVFENVAYPLRVRRMDQKTIDTKVKRALGLVGLEAFGSRPAPLLSGGQQQRVAIARALVYEPNILLLDEPFSNLDAKLREHMRMELRELQRQVGVTVLFVTHDQVEAITLSDRVVVMNQGKCEQWGRPQDLYENPNTAFVQSFLGQTVKLDVSVRGFEGDSFVAFSLPGTERTIVARSPVRGSLERGQDACLIFRPEYVQVEPGKQDGAGSDALRGNTMFGRISTLLFMGDRFESRIILDGGQEAILHLPKNDVWREGLDVQIMLPKDKGRIWPA
jgi:ABC-type Fe3+/spermidine/putrescine transport system ATPase subunit